MQETMTFTEQPLGLQFRSKMPMVISKIQEGTQASQLGVMPGWTVHSINGKLVAGLTMFQAYNTLVQLSAPLRLCMLVRTTPLDAISVEELADKLKSAEEVPVVVFLKRHGFLAESATSWENNVERPVLQVEIDGHREMGIAALHTWYTIVGKVITGEATSTRRWTVERRLAHVRALLHDPVKQELGDNYDDHFQCAPFALYGGLPGSTARMQSWLAALSKAIQAGAVSPALVVSILQFLEAPSLSEHRRQLVFPRAEPIPATVCLPDLPDRNDQNAESGVGACTREVPGNDTDRSIQYGLEQHDSTAKIIDVDSLALAVDDALDALDALEGAMPRQAPLSKELHNQQQYAEI